MPPSRNEPCPCGSGRKFKKCHGAVTAEVRVLDAQGSRVASIRKHQNDVSSEAVRFSRERRGVNWLPVVLDAYTDEEGQQLGEEEMTFAVSWALYHHVNEQWPETVGHSLLAERGARLLPDQRRVLEAQLASWLSIWEVQRVDRATGVEVTDVLTKETRFVHDNLASQSLAARDQLLARILTVDDTSIFGSVHPRVLTPGDAEAIAREMRKLCRVRTRPVKLAQLQDMEVQLELIDNWRWTLQSLDMPRPMPTMTNTDGDPVAPTVDHYAYDTRREKEIVERLTDVDGLEGPEKENGDTIFVFVRPGNAMHSTWTNTVTGHVRLRNGKLQVDSNSVKRANVNRKRIDELLGQLVTWRIREEGNLPAELAHRQATGKAGARPRADKDLEQMPEVREAMRNFRQQHMDAWVDEHVPALDGKTPREAVRTARGKEQVDVLLRDFENHEARRDAEDRIDIGRIRAKLGI